MKRTALLLILLLMLSLPSCQGPTEKEAAAPVIDSQTVRDKQNFDDAFILDRLEEDIERAPADSEGLVLSIKWLDANLEKYLIARIVVTNRGTVDSLVVPIHPLRYHIFAKNSEGREEEIFNLPPIDFMTLEESDLVKLSPRNSLYADYKVPRSATRPDVEYRVLIDMHYRVSNSRMTHFKHESKWERIQLD